MGEDRTKHLGAVAVRDDIQEVAVLRNHRTAVVEEDRKSTILHTIQVVVLEEVLLYTILDIAGLHEDRTRMVEVRLRDRPLDGHQPIAWEIVVVVVLAGDSQMNALVLLRSTW